MSTSGNNLAALCKQCGGAVPIVLAGQAISCPFCGSSDPLSPAMTERVTKLRTKIQRQKARLQKLADRQVEEAHTVGVWLLIMYLSAWLLITPLVYVSVGDLPDSLSLFDFLFIPYLSTGLTDPIAIKWWIVWYTAVGMLMTTLPHTISMIRVRRFVKHQLPRPPLGEGQPPCCRVCGAPLPCAAQTVSCTFCGAGHILNGQRYQRVSSDINAGLARLERSLDKDLARRSTPSNWTAIIGGIMPASLIVVMPVALFVGQTFPKLWILPGVLGVLTSALLIIALAMPVPKLRNFDGLFGGDSVLVDGVLFKILGAVHFWGPHAGTWKDGFYKVTAGASGEPAFFLTEHSRFPVTLGGAPLVAEDVSTDGASGAVLDAMNKVDVIRGTEALAQGPLLCLKQELSADPSLSVRLWLASPTPVVGSLPALTLQPEAEPIGSVLVPTRDD